MADAFDAERIDMGGSIIFLILPGGIIGGGSICTILALHFMTASEATLIFATQPMIVVALAWAFLREWVTVGIILSIGAAMIGVMGIVQTGTEIGSLNEPLGIIFAIVSTTAPRSAWSGCDVSAVVSHLSLHCWSFRPSLLAWLSLHG